MGKKHASQYANFGSLLVMVLLGKYMVDRLYVF